MLKAISFDGDGTLWDFESSMQQALAHILRYLQREFPSEKTNALTVARMAQIRDEIACEYAPDGLGLFEIRYRAFERLLQMLGLEFAVSTIDILRKYRHYRFDHVRAYPDVSGCLERLHPNYSLCIISNGNTSPKLNDLDHFFKELFDRIRRRHAEIGRRRFWRFRDKNPRPSGTDGTKGKFIGHIISQIKNRVFTPRKV